MIDGNEDVTNDDDTEDENNDEDLYESSDINVALNRISWLPSVLLGKQPHRSSSMMIVRENDDVTTQSIDILPVLPMTMVRGLEKMMMSMNSDVDENGRNLNNGGGDDDDDDDDDNYSRYGDGVWEGGIDESVLTTGLLRHASLFSATSYFPHTRGHILTVAEPR